MARFIVDACSATFPESLTWRDMIRVKDSEVSFVDNEMAMNAGRRCRWQHVDPGVSTSS
jgi:hypothetical protein